MKETLTFDSPRHRSYVVMHGEEVCGYCFISPFKNRDAYADTAEVTVYLRPGFTGKGAGGLAVDFMEGEARQRGFHCLIAVICAENGPSIRLFEKKGFQRCAHYREVGRKFGRLLDVVVYQKIIS
jgi:phosphinothricin acetyltransferase